MFTLATGRMVGPLEKSVLPGTRGAISDNIGSHPASLRLYSGFLKSSRTRMVIPAFSRDGAGLPQDAAKNGKHGAIGSRRIQLANLFGLRLAFLHLERLPEEARLNRASGA